MAIGKVVFGQPKPISVTLDRPVSSNVIADGGSVTLSSDIKATTIKVDQPTQTTITNPALSGETNDIIDVEHGGTGNTYLEMNSVLIGQGLEPIKTLSSNVEGEVLTIDHNGIPTFQMISGGTF